MNLKTINKTLGLKIQINKLVSITQKQNYKFCQEILRGDKKKEIDLQTLKKSIIQASLVHVNSIGYNDQAIGLGCLDLNISSASNKLVTPFDVIKFQMQEWNEIAIKKLENEINLGNIKGIKNIIHKSIELRLAQQVPYIINWNQAMAVGAYPKNVQNTFNLLWNYADEAWFLAGDRSIDYNFQTKRSIFLAVYASTELFMLTDKSQNYQATWQFLDRRLNDVLYFGQSAKNIQNIAFAGLQGLQTIGSIFYQQDNNKLNKEKDMDKLKQKL